MDAAFVLCYLAPKKIFLMSNLKLCCYPVSYTSSYEVWLRSSMALLGLILFVVIFRTDTGLILYLWSGLVSLTFPAEFRLFTNIYSNLFWPFWIHLLCCICLVSLTNIICILPVPSLMRILNHIRPMVDHDHLSFNTSSYKNGNHWKIVFVFYSILYLLYVRLSYNISLASLWKCYKR